MEGSNVPTFHIARSLPFAPPPARRTGQAISGTRPEAARKADSRGNYRDRDDNEEIPTYSIAIRCPKMNS